MKDIQAHAAAQELTRLGDGNPIVVSRGSFETTDYGVAWNTMERATDEALYDHAMISRYITNFRWAKERREHVAWDSELGGSTDGFSVFSDADGGM